MTEVWIGLAELERGADPDPFDGCDGAVVHVLATADSQLEFHMRCYTAADRLGTRLVELEDCEPFSDRVQHGHAEPDIHEAAARAQANRSVEWTTFHLFPADA